MNTSKNSKQGTIRNAISSDIKCKDYKIKMCITEVELTSTGVERNAHDDLQSHFKPEAAYSRKDAEMLRI